MMTCLQNICFQHGAAVYNIFFSLVLRVTAHDKAIIAIGKADSHGPVVQVVAVVFYRGKYGEGRVSQIIGIPGRGFGDFKSSGGNGVQYVLKGPGGMFHRGQEDLVHGKGINNLVQAADMVGMRMGANHIIQFCHSLCF